MRYFCGNKRDISAANEVYHCSFRTSHEVKAKGKKHAQKN